jgi:hypothetical protein
MRKIQGLRQNIGVAVVVFFCTLFSFSYLRPQPPIPNLSPVPLEAITGNPIGTTGEGVVLIVEIVNKGSMASVARGWSALQADIDGHVYNARPIRIPEVFRLGTNGKTITLSAQDSLYLKASAPIQPGGSVTGILAFVFEDIPFGTFENRQTNFKISYMDAVDHKYQIEAQPKPVADMTIQYFPGLKIEVH